ncbi:hypothetical protein DAPPUDRAFT_341087, partial [Daphnia pulex]
MADHFEIQSNRLVAEQIEIRIRRTVEGAILGPNAVYPKVVHLLPSLILALKNLEERKTDFQKKQSSSLDAITSVIPEYSGVGHRVGADRSISGDEVSRDNNRIIEIPTRANPARAEGSKRTSPGNQVVDG